MPERPSRALKPSAWCLTGMMPIGCKGGHLRLHAGPLSGQSQSGLIMPATRWYANENSLLQNAQPQRQLS
jgi:hypothetical protein